MSASIFRGKESAATPHSREKITLPRPPITNKTPDQIITELKGVKPTNELEISFPNPVYYIVQFVRGFLPPERIESVKRKLVASGTHLI